MSGELARLLAFAEELAEAARGIARAAFRRPLEVEDKPDATPVTEVDRRIEEVLRGRIAAAFPAHGVLGEEHEALRPAAEWVWVLDPIDGTKAFASGNPLFTTLIGLARAGEPVLGVIDAPALGERWSAHLGGIARHDGRPCRVRRPVDLSRAVLYAGAPETFCGRGEGVLERLRGSVRWTKYQADGYAYGLLAAGFVDLVVESDLGPHDLCALAPIVRASGGVFEDWCGAPCTLASEGDVLAATCPELAARVRELMARG